ncbi:unnamed protein product [Brachionus calyciflorus]|uniref:G-protein coupled receptors family 1 profile domain-containing protein n=1 Tax=Brachionus calyciflorus TaxID=104777 RepID=A0A814LCN7_9BILA|nr:unnamed protein product [Brachionus calyciflorus]
MKIFVQTIIILFLFKRIKSQCHSKNLVVECNFEQDIQIDDKFLSIYSNFYSVKLILNDHDIVFYKKFDFTYNFTLIFQNVSRFNFINSTSIFNYFRETQFISTKLDIYFNNKSLNDEQYCVDLIKKYVQVPRCNTEILEKNVYFQNVIFPSKICPFIFYNSFINTTYFKLGESMPNFFSFNFLDFFNITQNSLIKKIQINNSTLNLKSSFFNSLLHTSTEIIEILQCEIVSIDEDSFGQAFSITDLNFSIFNLKTFVRRNNHSWLNNINNFQTIELNDCKLLHKLYLQNTFFKKTYIIYNDLEKEYDFPDEDFCQFKYFPQNRFVFPLILSKPHLNCTCTLTWLLLNHKLNSYFEMENVQTRHLDINTSSVYKCFENFEVKVSSCNFSQRLEKCGLLDVKSNYYLNCSIEEKLIDSDCIRKFIEISAMIIVSFIGFPVAFSSFYALIKINLKENMFKYLRIQIGFETLSLFSLFFNAFIRFSSDILINSFDNKCDYDFRIDNKESQFFKSNIVNFITYFSISCALLSNLLMVLDRFLMITSSMAFKRFSEIKRINTLVLPTIIFIGLVLNFHHVELAELFVNKKKEYLSIRFRFYLVQDAIYIFVGLVTFLINIKLFIFLFEAYSKKSALISNTPIRKESEEILVKTGILVVLNCSLILLTRVPDFILSYKRISLFFISSETVITFDENAGEILDSMQFKKIFCSVYKFGFSETNPNQTKISN